MTFWSYRYTVLVLCMLAFFVTMVARLAISPVVPLIRAEFVISNTQIGIALTGLWLFYGVTQFPSGVLADRYGEKPIILIAVAGTTIMCVVIALAPGFYVFVLGVVLLGAIAGLHYSVATTLLSRTFDEFGTAVGIHTMGAPLAGLLAPVAAAWIGVRYGWRPAILLATVVGVPVALLFWWRVRRTPPRRPGDPMRDRFELTAIKELLSRRAIAFTVCLAIITTFTTQGVMSFLPTFLIEFRGLSTTNAGVVFAGFFVLMGAGQIALGMVSDRYGNDVALGGGMLLGSLGFLSFVFGPSILWLVPALALVGMGASYNAALHPRFMGELDEQERGGGFGLVRTIYGIIAATGSAGVGLFADLFGWGASFSILAVLSFSVFAALAINSAFDLGF